MPTGEYASTLRFPSPTPESRPQEFLAHLAGHRGL